jgi:hypothetical protein
MPLLDKVYGRPLHMLLDAVERVISAMAPPAERSEVVIGQA